MPPTFTLGVNTYATAAEFDLYMERIPDPYRADFDALGVYKKEQYLIWATQLLEANICWSDGSYRYTSAQSLNFPRIGIYSPDGTYLFNEQTIPQFMKDATCQLAFELTKSDLTAEPPRGLTSLTVGPITIDFDTNHAHDVKTIPRAVYSLLAQYGGYPCGKRGGVYTIPLFRS